MTLRGHGAPTPRGSRAFFRLLQPVSSYRVCGGMGYLGRRAAVPTVASSGGRCVRRGKVDLCAPRGGCIGCAVHGARCASSRNGVGAPSGIHRLRGETECWPALDDRMAIPGREADPSLPRRSVGFPRFASLVGDGARRAANPLATDQAHRTVERQFRTAAADCDPRSRSHRALGVANQSRESRTRQRADRTMAGPPRSCASKLAARWIYGWRVRSPESRGTDPDVGAGRNRNRVSSTRSDGPVV